MATRLAALAVFLLAAGCANPSPSSPLPSMPPVVAPTPTSTATPVPSPAPPEASAEPRPEVEITEFTRGLHAGDHASVTARTPAGVPCTLSYRYTAGLEGSSTSPPKMTKLDTKTANADGVIGWRWTVDPPADRDAGILVVVDCGDGEHAGLDNVHVNIWPSEVTSSTTLPEELLGTWLLRGESIGDPGDDVTFLIGPCTLGTQCGSLTMALQPACPFPLVFASLPSPDVVVFDAGDNDTPGCAERWGQGLQITPAGEATLQLSMSDLGTVLLHRVLSSPR